MVVVPRIMEDLDLPIIAADSSDYKDCSSFSTTG